jgi:hypothetical protein
MIIYSLYEVCSSLPNINNMIYSLYFSYINILVDAAVHSEHVQAIRCDIKLESVILEVDFTANIKVIYLNI